MDRDEQAVRRALADEAERVAGLGSYSWDLQTGEVLWSDNCFRLLGLEPHAVPPSQELFFTCVHPDDFDHFQSALQATITSEVGAPVYYRLIIDGAVRHVVSKAVAVRGPGGEMLRMVGTIQDRTHIHETRAALEEHAYALEQAQQMAHVGSWVWRPGTGTVTWTPELRRIAGLAPDSPVDPETFRGLIVPEDRARYDALVATSAPGVHRCELRIARPDGARRWLHLSLRQVPDNPRWSLCVVHDSTDQHRLAEAQQRQLSLATLGSLVSGVAHDFNNLLTVILGNVMLADLERPSTELDEALQATRAAAELTQRLLAQARPAPERREPLAIDRVVQHSQRLLRTALPERITLTVDTSADATVRADPRQLDQVLLNLVLNARDATPGAGRVTVQTRRDGETVVLAVIDHGAGMSPEVRARASEAFFTTKRPGKGTGLGLAMVRRVVEEMDGTLAFDETPGGGTTVVLRLPPATAPTAAAAAPSAPRSSVAGRTVLIVEDDPAVRRLAARLLSHDGWTVRTAAGPVEARDHQDTPVDVVLCDLSMPRGGGAAVVADFPGRPFVFMTAHAERPGWLAPYPVLAKPFLPEALFTLLRQALASGPPRP